MGYYKAHYLKIDELDREERLDIQFGKKLPSVADLERTHAPIGTVMADHLEHVFMKMQAENWSPCGEARELIEKSKTGHTSMCMGDVVEDLATKKFYFVAMVGFEEIS